MIGSLRGVVESVSGDRVAIDVNGVGYEVRCSTAALTKFIPGEKVRVVIHTDVREDAIVLYGFVDQLEKQVFLLLTQVQGVGAKSAADMIAQIDKRDLLRTIGSGDVQALTALKGVGKKTAERIVLELRERVAELVLVTQAVQGLAISKTVVSSVDEAKQALVSLGFSARDVERLIAEVASKNDCYQKLDTGELVRAALSFV